MQHWNHYREVKMKCTSLFAVLMISGLVATAAQAQDTPETRSWAVGWDNGIGMRHLLSNNWGVGLQVDPGIISRDVEEPYDGELTPPMKESDGSNLTVGMMVFKDRMLSKHLGVGPFCRLSYSRESDKQVRSPEGNPYTHTDRFTRDTYGIDIGIRPTFRFEEWLVLETRFGLMLSSTSTTNEAVFNAGSDSTLSRATTDETNLDVLGTNLGPGAVMQFMVYLW